MNDLYFIVDLETSGSDPIKNGVIEFFMIVTNEHLEIIETFYRQVCPPMFNYKTWSPDAAIYHGYSFEQVKRFMPNEQFCYELLLFLAKYKRPDNQPHKFVCHASPTGFYNQKSRETVWGWFDWYFMEWAFRKSFFQDGIDMRWSLWKILDGSKKISTVQLGRDAGYKPNDLKSWANRLNVKLDHHKAASDTYVCLEILKFFKEKHSIGF